MYNGTDTQLQRGEDNGILVKTAWDKFMVEVRKIFKRLKNLVLESLLWCGFENRRIRQ